MYQTGIHLHLIWLPAFWHYCPPKHWGTLGDWLSDGCCHSKRKQQNFHFMVNHGVSAKQSLVKLQLSRKKKKKEKRLQEEFTILVRNFCMAAFHFFPMVHFLIVLSLEGNLKNLSARLAWNSLCHQRSPFWHSRFWHLATFFTYDWVILALSNFILHKDQVKTYIIWERPSPDARKMQIH